MISTIYEFPFGKGKRLLGAAHGFVQGLVGGWQLQGWYEGQTGDALGFGNALFTGDLKNIPIPVSDRRAERWFNIDAGFNRNTQQQLANNIIGLSSQFTGVRADGINNFDFSLYKNFRIREKARAQFQVQGFNALNHVQFGPPNVAPANTAFGSITDEKGHGQRQITLAFKLLY